MEPQVYLVDPQRVKEIHHLLDQLPVPEESLSDVSSDNMIGRSTYEPESQMFMRGISSPGRHHEDFFENSINSTIAHTSPLSNIHMNEDSKMDSSLSQAFTPQQVSRMMDWSKNHITPADGLFPQVSAPSMSIEGDLWESSPQGTPLPTMILKSHSSVERSQNQSKKSLNALPVLDLPTHEEKPSREVITFSPNNAEANWYFNPAQNSKRSSANQSLKFPKNSFSTEMMTGSALLAHAANHHFPSEISLSQIRDNAPIFDEIHKLKSELINLKVVFRSEQNMHEETKKELYQYSNALQEMENSKNELEDKNAELEEKIKFLNVKLKNPENLEQLRGKTLEYARMEIKQLKGYLAEKDRKIEDFKHALSQKVNMENNSARDKEIEELTYEITRLKLVNNSQSKQIKELNDKYDKESKFKDTSTGELKNIIENYENKCKKLQELIIEEQKKSDEKSKEIEKISKSLKEMKQVNEIAMKEKESISEELKQAKENLEILKKQLTGTHFEKTSSADYDYQLNKIKSGYEKKLEEATDEINKYKNKCANHESKISALEMKITRIIGNADDSVNDEDKETLQILQEELKNLTQEYEELSRKNTDFKINEKKLIDQINALNSEKYELESEYEEKLCDYKDQINVLENMQLEYNKNLRKFEEDSQRNKDLISQYEEEMEKLRYAKKNAEQLSEILKRQLDELKVNESSIKLKAMEEAEKEILKAKNSINSLNAKSQFEKDELYQKLREKEHEINELKQELEENYLNSQEKLKMEVNFFKEKIEKEKDEEIKRLRKIYSSQSGTQTSFDYSNLKDEIKSQLEAENNLKISKQQAFIEEKLRKEISLELKEKIEHEMKLKYSQVSLSEKENYEKKIEDLNRKIENSKSEYSKNFFNLEQEFMNKAKSIESELAHKKNLISESALKIESLEQELNHKKEEIKSLNKKIKELSSENSKLLNKPSVVSSHEELDFIIKKTKDEVKSSIEKEKQILIESFEIEQNNLIQQNEKFVNDLKKKEEIIEELKKKEKYFVQEYEKKIEELENKYNTEIEDYKVAYSADLRESEKNFYIKEKKLEKEYSEKIQEITQEYQEKIEKEQEKYQEMLSKKDILSKADNQRVKEEVASLVSEKEKEITDQFNKKQKLVKSQHEKEIKSKELEIEALKESVEHEKRKIKEEFQEKINSLKQENLKNKREWEREQKKLKEMVEGATESAKKDLELAHLENINKEKAEWDRKEKNKIKIINSKHQKELLDREQVLKSEFELEKNVALQELSENYKQKIKQIQEDQKKYYEELKNNAVEEKSHEIEMRLRRELQDNYLKTISQMDSQHFQEKEKLREEFRNELAKRIEEVRVHSYIESESSYIDMPFSHKKSKVSVGESQELRSQIEIYRQKLEQIELEKETQKISLDSDLEKIRTMEYAKIVNFIQEELNCYFAKPIPKAKNLYPEISGLIRSFFNKLDIETELIKEKVRQEISLGALKSSGENKRKSISQTVNNVEIDDLYFLRYNERVYISLEKTLEDLYRLKNLLSEKSIFYENLSSKNLKEDYCFTVSSLQKLIPSLLESNSIKSSNYLEDKERLKKYDQDLKSLTNEYKQYILKSKEWLDLSNKKKEEWRLEKAKLEEKIIRQEEQLEKMHDSNIISPEMLSPEETASLVLGIFKRSNSDSIIVQILQQNQEFVSILHQLLENSTPTMTLPKHFSGHALDIQHSLNSARSYTRPKSVDVETAPIYNRPPRANPKFSSPISISQNYQYAGFGFPFDN